MRITLYNNSKSNKPNAVTFHVQGTTKVTKQEIKIQSDSLKGLVKQCSSKSGDETFVLRRFLNKSCEDQGKGFYIAGKLEAGNNFMIHVNDSWTIATVVQREGRSYSNKKYEMVIADKEGKMGVVYNIYTKTELFNNEAGSEVVAEDIQTLMEVIRIKDRQIEKLSNVNSLNESLGQAVLEIAKSNTPEEAKAKAESVVQVFSDELTGLKPVKNEIFNGISSRVERNSKKNHHLI